jgi:flagellar motor switch protein FliN/FliY
MSETQDAVSVRTNALLRELAFVHDIPLEISVEVGRLRLRVRDLLKMAPGVVLEMKKPAGEPFEICVNNYSVARGEVIVVEQTTGVRIIDIFKPGVMGQ